MHQNSSAMNGFIAKHENSSVHASARGIVGATRCNIVVHAGAVFTASVLDAIHRLTKRAVGGVSIHAVASQSDEETLDLIGTLGQQSDAFGLLGKNTGRVNAAL